MNHLAGHAESQMSLDQAQTIDAPHYTLESDLAKLCLPSVFRDANRKLAWVNSVCFLFIVIGLIGIKAPELITKPLDPQLDIVPVVFTPPPEPPKVEPQPQPDEPEKLPDEAVIDTPQIATVVAADPAAAAFAVPVEGPVVFAPARFAQAPPPTPPRPATPPKPTLFNSRGNVGEFPDPPYPSLALRRHNEGRVMLYVIVDATGAASSVQVKDSSGYTLLDTHSADWVKNKWRWPPGEIRYYYVPIEYQIR